MPYLDTSILGSYYCPETLSSVVNNALMSISNPIISPLVEVEFVSLLSLKVRKQEIERASADAIHRQFQRHRGQHLYRLAELGSREYTAARRMLAKFRTPLRTVDALHLAAAAAHRQQIWTTDRPLAEAARMLGMSCKLIAL